MTPQLATDFRAASSGVASCFEQRRFQRFFRVLVLGLTFKEDYSDDRNSRAKHLIRELETYGYRVLACDPWLTDERIRRRFGVEPVSLGEAKSRVAGGAVQGVVVAAPHRECRDMRLTAAAVVIDIKRALPGGYDSL